MKKDIRNSCVVLLVMTIITGLAYPLFVTAIAQIAFPKQAQGNLIVRDGTVLGSELIGQQFSKPEYFWGRLSATAPVAYNAAASSGSNLGPGNEALKTAASARAAELMKYDVPTSTIPIDLLTASGSGLDPHISPTAAEYQAPRVAKFRQMSIEQVRELIAAATEQRQFGILGEPRVNVLKLNLSLN